MLANRLWLTGSGLPTGSRNLMHFENNLRDEIQNSDATFTGGSPIFSTTEKKFGSYGMRTDTSTAISLVNSIIDFGTRDFTISFWLKAIAPSLSRVDILNVASFGTPSKNVFRLSKSTNVADTALGLEFKVNAGAYFVNTSTFNPILTTSFSYVKFGRKGTKLFLIINGTEYTNGSPTLPVNYILESNTTEPIRIGGTGGTAFLPPHDCWYDELLVQMDFGDDSLVVPTYPW